MLGLYLEVRAIPVLMWSFTGVLLGTAVAARADHRLAVWPLVASIAIGVLLQGVVAHSANDVVDWHSGTDQHPAERTLSGGSKVVGWGLLSVRDLAIFGAFGAVAAMGLGIAVAWTRGWLLIAVGFIGLLGALAYSLPPVRAAYRPFAGEATAFACCSLCTVGAYFVQRGTVGLTVVALGLSHGAACVAMLMVHHDLDRPADESAIPRKRTSAVKFGARGLKYGSGWGVLGAVLALALIQPLGWAAIAAAVGPMVAAVQAARTVPGDPTSVTASERLIIVSVIVGGLAAATLLQPRLAWAATAPLILFPLEAHLSAKGATLADRARTGGV